MIAELHVVRPLVEAFFLIFGVRLFEIYLSENPVPVMFLLSRMSLAWRVFFCKGVNLT